MQCLLRLKKCEQTNIKDTIPTVKKRVVLGKIQWLLSKSVVLCISGLCSPSLAFAYGGDDDQFSSIFSGMINLLTSTPARLMCVIAVIGVGYGTLALGKVPKNTAISVMVGAAIIFGAKWICHIIGVGE